jgi:KDO2-lipid IV(A) lauroyltransferase
VVTGRVHNPAVDRLLQDRRRELGLVPLPRDGGARPLLRHLGAGGVAAVLLDQNVAARTEVVPFFGRPAPTPAGLAVLALRRGIPVLPVALARDGRGGHLVRHLAPLVVPAGPAGDEEVRAFLTRCNARLERLIRRNPAEWVWFHDRWPA